MTDQGPFANWPNLDQPAQNPQPPKPAREERAYLILPGSTEPEFQPMASNSNSVETFLGGSPLAVAIRLLFISMIVGALLMWLELRPIDILNGVKAFFDKIYQLGFGAIKELASYVLAGAVIVVPAWFILRVMNMGGGGGGRR